MPLTSCLFFTKHSTLLTDLCSEDTRILNSVAVSTRGSNLTHLNMEIVAYTYIQYWSFPTLSS